MSARGIPESISNQFKVISPLDKIKIYDSIEKYSSTDLQKVSSLIKGLNGETMRLNWDGFQLLLNTICPIVTEKKLANLIRHYCQSNGEYSVLTAKLHYYLKGGFFGLMQHKIDCDKLSKDKAVRDTADLVYNVFRYQLVKYLGIFDLMYRYSRSIAKKKHMDEIGGIAILLQKLEYNALNQNARILSDFGVPFKLIYFYEKENNMHEKDFDDYESYIDLKIKKLIK